MNLILLHAIKLFSNVLDPTHLFMVQEHYFLIQTVYNRCYNLFTYVKFDVQDVKEAYLAAIPDLSLENTETKVYTSETRREMESKISELEKELAVKNDKVDLLFDEFEKFKKSVTWEDVKKEY